MEKIDHTGQSAVTTRWYLGRCSELEERDGGDALQATYINGARLDECTIMHWNRRGRRPWRGRRPHSTNYWYLESAIIGNIVALVNSSGSIQEGYTYRGYGQATVHTGAGNDGNWFASDDVTAIASALGNPCLFTRMNGG